MPDPKPVQPFRLGREAFAAGVSIDKNPFVGQIGHKGADMGQNWIWGWEDAAMTDLLSKTPIPDTSLIAECENLLPKCGEWCAHDMNGTLHHYRDVCKEGDVTSIKITERSLRKHLVRARLEAAGLRGTNA